MNTFKLLFIVITQRKDKSEINFFSWVWLGILSHTQSCWDFPLVAFSHVMGEVTLNVVQNERFIFSLHEQLCYFLKVDQVLPKGMEGPVIMFSCF